jgi:hypothetical protein
MQAHVRAWSVAVTASTAVVWFAHECGHGFGYRLRGDRVSTGFNMVGGPGMVPGQPGFRSAVPVTGTPNLGTLLGPLTTWVVTCGATAVFARWPTGRKGSVFSATAVSAALQRLLPLVPFFAAAPFGRVVYQDEVEWGARHVGGLSFPMSFEAFQDELRDRPTKFLRTPAFYAGPVASAALSAACLHRTYRTMRRQSGAWIPSRSASVVIPIAAWIGVGAIFSVLDRAIRIEW